jgi:hypothetical protein
MQDHNRHRTGAGTDSTCALRLRSAVVAVAVGLGLSALPAQAGVYRCMVGGVVQYSDQPCQAGDTPLDLRAPNVVQPDADDAALAGQHDRRTQAYQKARSAEDAAWRKDYETRSADAERIRAARANREVVRGMREADVRRLLGEPARTATTSGKGGAKETWSYADDGDGRVTVTLQAGVVTDVRRSGAGKKK